MTNIDIDLAYLEAKARLQARRAARARDSSLDRIIQALAGEHHEYHFRQDIQLMVSMATLSNNSAAKDALKDRAVKNREVAPITNLLLAVILTKPAEVLKQKLDPATSTLVRENATTLLGQLCGINPRIRTTALQKLRIIEQHPEVNDRVKHATWAVARIITDIDLRDPSIRTQFIRSASLNGVAPDNAWDVLLDLRQKPSAAPTRPATAGAAQSGSVPKPH